MGLSIETLTTYEALVVAAMLVDSGSDEEISKFKLLSPADQTAFLGIIAEGESAANLLSDKPISAPKIISILAALMHVLKARASEGSVTTHRHSTYNQRGRRPPFCYLWHTPRTRQNPTTYRLTSLLSH